MAIKILVINQFFLLIDVVYLWDCDHVQQYFW